MRRAVSNVTALPALRAKGGAPAKPADVFGAKKVVLVGVVGAFTGVCTASHVPGYAKAKDALRAKGVDSVAVVSVNDHLVLNEWKKTGLKLENEEFINVLSDHDAAFTKALGLTVDLSSAGLGVRSKRYAMIVENGKIVKQFVEDSPGNVTVSGAENVLKNL